MPCSWIADRRGRDRARDAARAPAPSVTLTASARPFSGAALATRSRGVARDRRRDLGGDDETVGGKLVLRASASPRLFVQISCPVSSMGKMRWQGPPWRALTRVNRTPPCRPFARNLDDALAPIADGCVLAVPRESLRRADGGDPGADPPRRQAAASDRAADLDACRPTC